MAEKPPRSPMPTSFKRPVVSFPTSNLDDYSIEEIHDTRAPDYKPAEFGSLHPDQTRFPGAVLTEQGPVSELDERYAKRKYEVLPGVVLEGEIITAEGQVGTITQQAVAAGTSVPTPDALTVSSSVKPKNAAVSVKELVKVAEVFDDKEVTKAIPEVLPEDLVATVGYGEEVSEVVAGTSADPSLGTDELRRSEQRLTTTKIRRTTRKKAQVPLLTTLSGKQVVGQFGGGVAATSKKLTATGELSATPDYLTLSAGTTPLGDGRFIEEVSRSTEAWPTLHESEFVPELSAFVETEKTVLANSGQQSSLVRTGGYFRLTEYRDADKWRTIQIVSKIPDDILYHESTFRQTINYSIPNEIPVAPSVVKVYHFTPPSAGEPADVPGLGDDYFRAAMVTDMELDFQVVEGYSGPMPATVTRTVGTSSSDVQAYQWFPQAVARNLALNLSYMQSGNTGARGKIQRFVIPSSIHGDWSIPIQDVITVEQTLDYCYDDAEHTVVSTGWPKLRPANEVTDLTCPYWSIRPIFEKKTVTLDVPATTPSAIPHGEEIIAAVKSERWRFGLWINEVYRVKVP